MSVFADNCARFTSC